MKTPTKDIDLELVRASEWLLGWGGDPPSGWRFQNWNNSKRRLASPLRYFLGEVERFSLDLGPTFTPVNQTEGDIRIPLLERVARENRWDDLLYLALERGATTGGVYFFVLPGVPPQPLYRVFLFDETEVYRDPSGDGYLVESFNGETYTRMGFSSQNSATFISPKSPNSLWEVEKVTPHHYGFVPGVAIPNKIGDHSQTPLPTFDWLAIEMATEICSQMLASASNHTYFGGPLLVSPNREDTLDELRSRTQVISGSTDQTMQDTAILKADAMPASHSTLMTQLWGAFSSHLGINWVTEQPSGDTSSLTLRLLFSKTVNTSGSYARTYIQNGMGRLFQTILDMAALDGMHSFADNTLALRYQNDIFPLTTTERGQLLANAETLTQMGVLPEVALAEYFPDKTTDDIRDLLLGV